MQLMATLLPLPPAAPGAPVVQALATLGATSGVNPPEPFEAARASFAAEAARASFSSPPRRDARPDAEPAPKSWGLVELAESEPPAAGQLDSPSGSGRAKGDDALANAAPPSVTADAVTADAADEPRPDTTPGLATIPRDVSSAIESYLDKADWDNYRQVSKGVAAVAAEGVQRVVIHRREDLSRALEAFASPGLKKLTARPCRLGEREAQTLAAQITSLDLSRNNIRERST